MPSRRSNRRPQPHGKAEYLDGPVTPSSGRGIGELIGAGGTAAADRAQDLRSIVGDDSVKQLRDEGQPLLTPIASANNSLVESLVEEELVDRKCPSNLD